MVMNPIAFNFGPIARTSAGDTNDTINLASLPLHVLLDALTAATSAEEFIAWLWHDLYKPAFQWRIKANCGLCWHHIPRIPDVLTALDRVTARTRLPGRHVSTYH